MLPAVAKLGVPVSIDTIKAETAAWALDEGASIVNDVWGLQRDPDMAPLVATRGVPVIVMHNRESADETIDIIADMDAFFARSLEIAAQAGIARDKIVLDPGIGFGKTQEQSILCLGKLDALKHFGLPLLVGASRKRFINSVVPSEPGKRIGGSIAAHLLSVAQGAAIVRVHDVAETVQALRVAGGHRGRAMSDRIFIKGLALHAYHGVMPHEGKVGQTFSLDLELNIDLSTAARSDRVAHTVSYDKAVTCASDGLLRPAFPADRGRRRRGRRRAAQDVSAGARGDGDDPQAARADRRHLRRRRHHADARAGRREIMTAMPGSRSAAMSATAAPSWRGRWRCSATTRPCG